MFASLQVGSVILGERPSEGRLGSDHDEEDDGARPDVCRLTPVASIAEELLVVVHFGRRVGLTRTKRREERKEKEGNGETVQTRNKAQ